MNNRLLFSVLLFVTFAISQQLDDSYVSIRAGLMRGGVMGVREEIGYTPKLPVGLSAHLGWANLEYNGTTTSQNGGGVDYDYEGPATGWLDLGLSWHPKDVKTGFNPGLIVTYAIGLRDGSGWTIGITPIAQMKTSDDNLLNILAQVEFGSIDPIADGIVEWLWCWESFYFGPRIGYAALSSNPVAGMSIGYRF